MPRTDARPHIVMNDDIPDMERRFLTPAAAAAYREEKDLEEIFDFDTDSTDSFGVHLNCVARKEHVMQRTFLVHACMQDGDSIDVIYSFRTMYPTPDKIAAILLSDYGNFVATVAYSEYVSVQ